VNISTCLESPKGKERKTAVINASGKEIVERRSLESRKASNRYKYQKTKVSKKHMIAP
jgi:hypothetical protein